MSIITPEGLAYWPWTPRGAEPFAVRRRIGFYSVPVTASLPDHVRARGELDLDALRALDRSALLDGIDRAVVWEIPLRNRFRGLTRRDGVLLHGPAGWGEVAPFWDYDAEASAPWLASALEAATGVGPAGRAIAPPAVRRDQIQVNVTIPEVPADRARVLVRLSGAATAKVKVAGSPGALQEDLRRLEAVRDALGPAGRIRIDVNRAWDVETARTNLPLMNQAASGLEYVEQPCASATELAALRRTMNLPVAADESIRLSADPLAVVGLRAADIAVLKVAPLGGVTRTLALAERLGLPAVVSSALDTSVGIFAGLTLAAALPDLDRACGLGTITLLGRDVAVPSLAPRAGILTLQPLRVSRSLLGFAAAGEELTARWQARMGHLIGALRARRERERRDPRQAVAGLPL